VGLDKTSHNLFFVFGSAVFYSLFCFQKFHTGTGVGKKSDKIVSRIIRIGPNFGMAKK
jgi:hypothetical protein